MTKTLNVKSQIIDKLNAVVIGDQNSSSLRLETLILTDDAVRKSRRRKKII